MMRPFEHQDELRALLDALCADTLSAEQLRRLEELVLSHPEAEAYYVQVMSLHADLLSHFRVLPSPVENTLRQHDRAQATAAVVKKPAAGKGQGRRARSSRRLLGPLLLLAGLAAALAVAFVASERKHTYRLASLASSEEELDASVAVLLQAPGADWGGTDPPPRIGAPLSPRRLLLKSGLAQIEFYSGATVILEGPADLQLLSTNEAYCRWGKLRATVPEQARGFTITTPKLDLVDRGTEFGLSINPERTEVHVFKGIVELYDANPERADKPSQELTTGCGIRLEEPGTTQAIASDSSAFLTARDLAARREAELRQRRREWQSASNDWKRDPSLLVYYTFQNEQRWSRTVLDRATAGEKRHDGTMVGCTWGTGRWPGKKGLEFKQITDRVRLHVPGSFDTMTMAAWVRVDTLANRFNSLMMADGGEEAAPHWHIGNNGTIELGVQGYQRKKWAHYLTPKVFTPDRLGCWSHLAVVYDRTNGRVAHYLDGKVVADLPLQLDIDLRLGNAEIGNWNVGPRRHYQPIRYFSGCIDEFMLFSRALADDEVLRLYEQGRPPS